MSAPSPDAEPFERVRQALALDAPLDQRLAMISDMLSVEAPDVLAVIDGMVGRLRAGDAGAGAPAIGDIMPPFVLPDETGRLVTMEAALRDGPLVLSFLRGHWCPFCRVTAWDWSTTDAEIRDAGGHLMVITPERQHYNATLKRDVRAGFPILTDIDNGYALAIGLAIWVGAEMQALMEAAGRDLTLYQGGPSWLLPIPATFVIAPDGRVVARHIDPDYRERMRRDEVIRAVRSAVQAAAGSNQS
jgi:peroxiredoxin